jgi:hypothetical protein
VHWLDALTPPLEKNLERLVATVLALLPATEQKRPAPEPAIDDAQAQAQDEARAEDERRAEEETRREREEVEARERAEQESRARDAEAKRRGEQERGFAKAKAADTVAALDAFLATYPVSHLVANAKALRATLAARDEAYKAAIVNADPLVLKAFIERYPEGKLSMQMRKRLQRLEHPKRKISRRALMIGLGAVGAGAIIAATVIVASWGPNEQKTERVTPYVPPNPFTPLPTPVLDTTQCNDNLCGTSWALTNSEGFKMDIHFLQKGIFYFSDSGSPTNNDYHNWLYSVVGDSVSWRAGGTAEYHGTVRGRYMSGTAKNDFGKTWTWSAVKK